MNKRNEEEKDEEKTKQTNKIKEKVQECAKSEKAVPFQLIPNNYMVGLDSFRTQLN